MALYARAGNAELPRTRPLQCRGGASHRLILKPKTTPSTSCAPEDTPLAHKANGLGLEGKRLGYKANGLGLEGKRLGYKANALGLKGNGLPWTGSALQSS